MRRRKRCCCCWGFCGAVVGVVRGKPGGVVRGKPGGARAKPRGVGAGARAKPRGVGASARAKPRGVGAGRQGVSLQAWLGACYRFPLRAPPALAAPPLASVAGARLPRGGTIGQGPMLPPASRGGRWPSSLLARGFVCAPCMRWRRPCGATRRQRPLGSKYEPCPLARGSAPHSPSCRAAGEGAEPPRGRGGAEPPLTGGAEPPLTGRSLRVRGAIGQLKQV